MVVMSESSRQDEPRTWWKEAIKRRIVGLYLAALVGGQHHVEYLVNWRCRATVFTGYDVVDNAYPARSGAIRRSEVRSQRKSRLPENYFLASARFIEKKNLATLISAYAEYQKTSTSRSEVRRSMTAKLTGTSCSLGDSPLREALDSQLSTLNLNEQVHLPGFDRTTNCPFTTHWRRHSYTLAPPRQ